MRRGRPEVAVEKRADLALDARTEREEQHADVDAHLHVLVRDRHLARDTRPLEMESVTVPFERPAVLVLQPVGDRLRPPPGVHPPETVPMMDDDWFHRAGSVVTGCLEITWPPGMRACSRPYVTSSCRPRLDSSRLRRRAPHRSGLAAKA